MTRWARGGSVTEDKITAFERLIGHRLPEDYRTFVKTNDGAVNRDDEGLRVTGPDGRSDVYGFYPMPMYRRDGRGLCMGSVNAPTAQHSMPDVIVFAVDGGGCDYAFDYTASTTPRVVYVNYRYDPVILMPVADSFTDLCGMLVSEPVEAMPSTLPA